MASPKRADQSPTLSPEPTLDQHASGSPRLQQDSTGSSQTQPSSGLPSATSGDVPAITTGATEGSEPSVHQTLNTPAQTPWIPDHGPTPDYTTKTAQPKLQQKASSTLDVEGSPNWSLVVALPDSDPEELSPTPSLVTISSSSSPGVIMVSESPILVPPASKPDKTSPNSSSSTVSLSSCFSLLSLNSNFSNFSINSSPVVPPTNNVPAVKSPNSRQRSPNSTSIFSEYHIQVPAKWFGSRTLRRKDRRKSDQNSNQGTPRAPTLSPEKQIFPNASQDSVDVDVIFPERQVRESPGFQRSGSQTPERKNRGSASRVVSRDPPDAIELSPGNQMSLDAAVVDTERQVQTSVPQKSDGGATEGTDQVHVSPDLESVRSMHDSPDTKRESPGREGTHPDVPKVSPDTQDTLPFNVGVKDDSPNDTQRSPDVSEDISRVTKDSPGVCRESGAIGRFQKSSCEQTSTNLFESSIIQERVGISREPIQFLSFSKRDVSINDTVSSSEDHAQSTGSVPSLDKTSTPKFDSSGHKKTVPIDAGEIDLHAHMLTLSLQEHATLLALLPEDYVRETRLEPNLLYCLRCSTSKEASPHWFCSECRTILGRLKGAVQVVACAACHQPFATLLSHPAHSLCSLCSPGEKPQEDPDTHAPAKHFRCSLCYHVYRQLHQSTTYQCPFCSNLLDWYGVFHCHEFLLSLREEQTLDNSHAEDSWQTSEASGSQDNG